LTVSGVSAISDFEGFDWSGGNGEKNWERHRVTPAEIEQVFFNRPLLTGVDAAHSLGEARWYALGRSDSGRELFAAFTVRAGRIRVISARDMSRRERRVYGS
jgi:hypothetical protein